MSESPWREWELIGDGAWPRRVFVQSCISIAQMRTAHYPVDQKI